MIMGEISKQLHGKLKAMASNVLLPQTSKGRKPSPETPDIAELIADGLDPIHATMVRMKASSYADAPHRLMKFGPTKNYWNEFVFRAYHHHQADAIYLSGIPDLKSTLRHA